jgi:hypothetical protein
LQAQPGDDSATAALVRQLDDNLQDEMRAWSWQDREFLGLLTPLQVLRLGTEPSAYFLLAVDARQPSAAAVSVACVGALSVMHLEASHLIAATVRPDGTHGRAWLCFTTWAYADAGTICGYRAQST